MLPNINEFLVEMEEYINRSEVEYGDWKDYGILDLVEHFKEEVQELLDLVENECRECGHRIFSQQLIEDSRDEIASEAIDVANMAFFIWWQAKYGKVGSDEEPERFS